MNISFSVDTALLIFLLTFTLKNSIDIAIIKNILKKEVKKNV